MILGTNRKIDMLGRKIEWSNIKFSIKQCTLSYEEDPENNKTKFPSNMLIPFPCPRSLISPLRMHSAYPDPSLCSFHPEKSSSARGNNFLPLWANFRDFLMILWSLYRVRYFWWWALGSSFGRSFGRCEVLGRGVLEQIFNHNLYRVRCFMVKFPDHYSLF